MDWELTWEQFQALDQLIGALRNMRGGAQGEITNPDLNLKIEWDTDKVTFIIAEE